MANRKDLTGLRFGKLTVIKRTEKRQNNYWMWQCRCDCGGEILVNTRRLTRGTVTDCGCVPKLTARNGSIAEDLTGKQFGNLTVIRRASNKKGRTCWQCRCSCGKMHTVSAHDLKSGKVKSCGCLRRRKEQGMRDITGQKFGRLTALFPTKERDKKGSILWQCRCDCGRELKVSEDGLVHGHYRSCGCLKQELQKNIASSLTWVDNTCVEWLEKRKHRKDNTSGFRGICRGKNGSYRVTIGFKKQRFYVGTFRDFDEAVQARLKAEELIHDGFIKAYYRWKRQGGKKPFIYEVVKADGEFQVSSNIL
ncbi:MAG: hypothetical protein ACOX8H_14380 [Ruminococcus sp.]